MCESVAAKHLFLFVGVAEGHVNTTSTQTNGDPSVSSSNSAGPKSSQSTSVSSDLKPTQTPPKSELSIVGFGKLWILVSVCVLKLGRSLTITCF